MSLIDRIISKIKREKIKYLSKNAIYQKDNTYTTYLDNQRYYDPLLAGVSTFSPDCVSSHTIRKVSEILRRLTPDPYLEFILDYYQKGLTKFADKWKYADILTVLYAIATNIKIDSYLEIGVRRGRSMAIIASQHPESTIIGFDMWLDNYAGMKNPGPQFVEQELNKVGYKKKPYLVTGNSRITVPNYFKQHPDAFFDLVTVDGDHSYYGAKTDLKNVIPRLKIGGVLVFDDITNISHPALKKLWTQLITNNPRFTSWQFEELGYGVGFAIKKY